MFTLFFLFLQHFKDVLTNMTKITQESEILLLNVFFFQFEVFSFQQYCNIFAVQKKIQTSYHTKTIFSKQRMADILGNCSLSHYLILV